MADSSFDLNKTLNSPGGPDGSTVRVRFAPSPTGHLHVGGARTHLFNWLHAKHAKGKLIVRIEDTDTVRSTRESEEKVLHDIKSLGLDPDEGVEQGGPYAPYRQSERQPLFKALAMRLFDEGKAYRCFCTDKIIEEKALAAKAAGKPPHYDGTCTRIPRAESDARAAKESFSIRMKAPQKDLIVHDLLRGEVPTKMGMLSDFVILRSNGMPVYNFSVVVDDYYMRISHVIRGEDHLSNTNRQVAICDGLGWAMPQYVHISMILGTDKRKLSKREGASSVTDYLNNGYLPEALVNFLALLGWSPPQELGEVLPIEKIIANFDIAKLSKSPAVFDDEKLAWMNGEYIKAMDIKELAKRIKPFVERAGYDTAIRGEEWFLNVLATVRGGLRTLAEIGPHLEIYYADKFGFENDAKAMLATDDAKKVVKAFREEVEKNKGVNSEQDLATIQNTVKERTGIKGKTLFMSIRASVTGKQHGPELKLVLPLLGVDETLRRIDASLSI